MARHVADSHTRRLRIIAGLTASLLAVGAAVTAATAAADPITCPAGQTSQKVDNQWVCVNGGGNTSNADETKNPTN